MAMPEGKLPVIFPLSPPLLYLFFGILFISCTRTVLYIYCFRGFYRHILCLKYYYKSMYIQEIIGVWNGLFLFTLFLGIIRFRLMYNAPHEQRLQRINVCEAGVPI